MSKLPEPEKSFIHLVSGETRYSPEWVSWATGRIKHLEGENGELRVRHDKVSNLLNEGISWLRQYRERFGDLI